MLRLIALTLCLGACDRALTSPAPPSRGSPPTAVVADARRAAPDGTPTPADAGPLACTQMSRAQCLASSTCTLHHVKGQLYDCRDDKGPCEVGLQQGDQAACSARAQCAWDGGSCYCPCAGYGRTAAIEEDSAGCACGCAGGPPASCREDGAGAPPP